MNQPNHLMTIKKVLKIIKKGFHEKNHQLHEMKK